MWIKRAKYDELVRAEALNAHLQNEIEYWRGKFEDERARADRIGDRAFEMDGRAPVSVTGIREARVDAKAMKEEMERRIKEMSGAWEEDDGSEFIHDDQIELVVEGGENK